MNIYEIDQAILALVDPETGELQDYEAFQALQMERDQKIENIACWVKDLAAGVKAIKEEEKALAERRKGMERQKEMLKTYLQEILNGQKFSSARCSISYRGSKALEVEDNMEVADWLESNGFGDLYVTTVNLDKTELKRMVQSGVAVPGCSIVERSNMQIK